MAAVVAGLIPSFLATDFLPKKLRVGLFADSAGARRSLDELVKAYPQSEAAVAAKERLTRLR